MYTQRTRYKVSGSKLVTSHYQSPMFELFEVRCGPKNGHQKGIAHLKEIGLRPQTSLFIVGSIFNFVYDYLRRNENLHFENAGAKKIFK